jgi:hypothetical protein
MLKVFFFRDRQGWLNPPGKLMGSLQQKNVGKSKHSRCIYIVPHNNNSNNNNNNNNNNMTTTTLIDIKLCYRTDGTQMHWAGT